MKIKGSITIYLSLIFVCVSALICGLVESAYTAGIRYYARVYSDSALDSLFSEYHKQLWDEYRILALECDDISTAANQIEAYIKPYTQADNWFVSGTDAVEIKTKDLITDQGGAWFEQEVLDYMKYAALNLQYDESSAPELKENIEEAQAMKDITDDYGSHSKEAAGVEKQLMRISEKLSDMVDLYNEAMRCLNNQDGSGFRKKAKKIKSLAGDIPSMVDKYVTKADKLSDELLETKQSHDEDWIDLKEQSKQLLESDLDSYDTYIQEDGQRRQEIVSLKDRMDSLKTSIDDAIEYSIEVEEEIEDADEDDEIDEDELWEGVADYWEGIEIPTLGCAKGLNDEGKEDILEDVMDILAGDIFALVIPDGRTVSSQSIDNISIYLPSNAAVTVREKPSTSLLENLIVTEYSSRFLKCFTDNDEGPLQYELEYVASGKESDKSNLNSVLTKILAIREGLNYLYILSDEQMRETVSGLAATIAALTGIPGLNLMLEYMIIGVWALAESMMDLKGLLSGKKVPIYKDTESWQTSLEGMMEMAGGNIDDDSKDSEDGITYEDYLKFLVFLMSDDERDYRTMDIIQTNIMHDQDDFRMNNCIYGMKAEATSKATHLFTNISITRDSFFGLSPTWDVKTEAIKAY